MMTQRSLRHASLLVALATLLAASGCANTPGSGWFGRQKAKAARDPDPNGYAYGVETANTAYSPTSEDPAAFRSVDEDTANAQTEEPGSAIDQYVARLEKAASESQQSPDDAIAHGGNANQKSEGIAWHHNNVAQARPLNRNHPDGHAIPDRPRPNEQAIPDEAPLQSRPAVTSAPAVESVGVRSGGAITRATNLNRNDDQPIARTASSSVRAQQGMALDDLAKSRDLQQLIDAAKIAVVNDPSNPRTQLRLSLLQLANDQPEAAAQLSPAIGHRERELISQFVTSIGKVDRRFSDPLLDTDAVLASIDDLRDSLRDTAELTIPTVALCSRVQTFGIYDEIPAARLRAHQVNQVIVYCEVDHFKSRFDESSGQFRTELGSHLELFTASGQSIWSQTESQITDLSRQQREDFFLAQLVSFPGNISAGEYVLKVAITDSHAQKTTEAVHRFEVQ
jgi:hypothetical protein